MIGSTDSFIFIDFVAVQTALYLLILLLYGGASMRVFINSRIVIRRMSG